MRSFCVIENNTKEVNSCAFSDDYFVTCSGDKTVRVYSARNFQELKCSPIQAFKYGVNFVTFDDSGKFLASVGNDGKAHLFQLSDYIVKTLAVFRHSDTNTANVCAFSHDSKRFVTGSADGSIAWWDIERMKLIREITGHPDGNVYAATFSPCSCFLVTGSALGDIRVWDTTTMRTIMQTQAHDKGISACGVTCIKFSPTFHDSITDPNRCYLMASCGQDSKIKIWVFSFLNRSLKAFQELSGHQGPVSCCCFSPDGKSLASSSFDKTIIVWDPITCEQQYVLDGHGTVVTSVAYSKQNLLASTSYDKKVIVWKFNDQDSDEDLIDLTDADALKQVTTEQITPANTNQLVEPKPDNVQQTFEDWSCEQVVSWLTDTLKLGQYSSNFSENEIDGAELTGLTSEILQKDLGIAPLGHRNKIIRGIKSLQENKQQRKSATNNPSMAMALGCDMMTTSQAMKLMNLARQLEPEATKVVVTDKRAITFDNDQVPDQYLCPISREIMKDPVIAADGFTYERNMIEEWFLKGNKLSPMSNKHITAKKLIPNQTLKSLINEYIEEKQEKATVWTQQ